MQTQKFLAKTFIKMHDYWHLLFKSAAENQLRIQELQKNADGTYELTVKFGSFSELKRYQKKLRRVTVSLSSAVAMVIVALIVSPYILNPNRSSASSFQWIQNSWGGAANSNAATKAGTTNYASKDTNVTAAAGGVSLTLPTPASTGDNSYTGATGFYRSDGTGTYSVSGAALTLKKPTGATCGAGGNLECVSGGCAGSVCIGPCSASTTCGQSCIYNDDIYATLTIGTQCWFAENMRTPKYADGSAVAYVCYSGDDNCASPNGLSDANGKKYGPWYTWNAATVSGASTQGICPTSWHIPTDNEFYVLENFLQTSGSCSATRTTADCAPVGTILKSGGSSGFHLPLAGYTGGGRGTAGYMWSATPSSATYSWIRSVSSVSSPTMIARNTNLKTNTMSVRCLKD